MWDWFRSLRSSISVLFLNFQCPLLPPSFPRTSRRRHSILNTHTSCLFSNRSFLLISFFNNFFLLFESFYPGFTVIHKFSKDWILVLALFQLLRRDRFGSVSERRSESEAGDKNENRKSINTALINLHFEHLTTIPRLPQQPNICSVRICIRVLSWQVLIFLAY